MWYKTEKIPAGDINFFLDMIPYISRHIEEIRRGEDGVEILCSEDHQEEVLASLTRLENMIGEGKFAKKDVKPACTGNHKENHGRSIRVQRHLPEGLPVFRPEDRRERVQTVSRYQGV